MFKRIMLAGLMSATVLGGIVPAYAQERAPRGERGMRNGDGAAVSRGNRMNQPRGDAGRAAGTQPRDRIAVSPARSEQSVGRSAD